MIITKQEYLYAKKTFWGLNRMVDNIEHDWRRRFNCEVPDDLVRDDVVAAIVKMFTVIVKYHGQQKQRAGN
jgi:hypothetical protein